MTGKFKTFITLTTDASFYKEKNVGGYAFWISSSVGKYRFSGSFKNDVISATDAELKCIVNGVTMLRSIGIKADILQINTDCLNAIHLFTDDKNAIKRYNLTRFDNLKKLFFQALNGRIKKVQFKHIKSHEHTLTARNWVNDWCDQKAKEAAKIALEKKEMTAKTNH